MRLCRLADLEATGAAGVTADGREIVCVRTDSGVAAYVNVCPHQGTPLETFPGRFLNADRTLLICSTHGARFRVEDGVCISGPCTGARLTPVPVRLDGEAVGLGAGDVIANGV